MSDLPDSWETRPLGAINQFASSTLNPASRPEEVFELYSVPSFPTGKPERVLGSAIGSTKQTVAPGDVLISKINPRINRVWTVGPKTAEVQIASSEWIGFRSAAVQPSFANYYFKSPDFREMLVSEVAGVGGSLTRAQPKRVAEYPIPIAPAAEQTRIANQLDTLLTRIQSCNDRFDAIPALLKRFRQTVLDQAASGALTEDWRINAKIESPTWKKVTLNDVTSEMRNGLAQKPNEQPPGAKILRIGAVRTMQLDLSDHRYLEVSHKEALQYQLLKDDLLFTRYNGSLEFVGVCVALKQDAPNYVYPDKLIRVRARTDLALPKFIEIVFGSRPIRQQVEGSVKSSAGQRGISGSDLKGTSFELAPLEEQAEIVRRVDALLNLADRIEVRATGARAHAKRLSPLVLAKAFRGELVSQDPQDESASALLERIAAQRAVPAAKKQSSKPRQARATRAPKETPTMTKSRQDDDVKGKPYLADHLRRLGSATTAEVLFKASELPVADFYKQLAWEVAQGHIADGGTKLEARHAAR